MKIQFAIFLIAGAIVIASSINAAELPDWNINKWCEKAAEAVSPNKWDRASYRVDCKKKENDAKERLAKMDDAQDTINLLAKDTAPNEQSYVLLETVVKSMRKK